tara:strand:+ start:214 stop:453 length:240 start_codon:yes stop_codon:yes gene_type:complete
MKITKQQLQQVIKEEITNVLNEEYSLDMEVFFDTIMDYAKNRKVSKEIMDDLLAMRVRHGGMKPSGEPVGDVDMSGYDI